MTTHLSESGNLSAVFVFAEQTTTLGAAGYNRTLTLGCWVTCVYVHEPEAVDIAHFSAPLPPSPPQKKEKKTRLEGAGMYIHPYETDRQMCHSTTATISISISIFPLPTLAKQTYLHVSVRRPVVHTSCSQSVPVLCTLLHNKYCRTRYLPPAPRCAQYCLLSGVFNGVFLRRPPFSRPAVSFYFYFYCLFAPLRVLGTVYAIMPLLFAASPDVTICCCCLQSAVLVTTARAGGHRPVQRPAGDPGVPAGARHRHVRRGGQR